MNIITILKLLCQPYFLKNKLFIFYQTINMLEGIVYLERQVGDRNGGFEKMSYYNCFPEIGRLENVLVNELLDVHV